VRIAQGATFSSGISRGRGGMTGLDEVVGVVVGTGLAVTAVSANCVVQPESARITLVRIAGRRSIPRRMGNYGSRSVQCAAVTRSRGACLVAGGACGPG